MNNNINNPALFRSLVVFAVCVLLAIIAGFMLTNPMDLQSLGFVGVVAAVLIFPLLMKWHYPLLVFSWSCPILLFFLPGRPSFFLGMAAASLGISVVERILNRDMHFVPAAFVKWPLAALMLVVIITAELNGGLGFKAFGSDIYGGRKYATLFIGILGFFALTARPIPKNKANLYVGLYFAGSLFSITSDLYGILPSPLHFIYVALPDVGRTFDSMGNYNVELGVTRLSGVAGTAGAVFCWLLARHGVRDIFLGGKPWRPLLLGLSFILIFMGGFRSSIIGALIIFGIVFVLEKMHRSILMLPMLMIGIASGVALVPLASHLPYTFQRSLAFLPLPIDPEARLDAEGTTQWRLDMWQTLLPTIPQYLLLGKGYSFTPQTFNEYMGAGATFKAVAGEVDPLAMSSDFHNGPLSVIIPFGIWGAVAWLWFLAAGFWVVWRNYRHGDPEIRHINLFFIAFFVSKSFEFFFIFGGLVEDVAGFGVIVGLSLAMNNGVCRPKPLPRLIPDAPRPRSSLPAQPAIAG